jgi:hypothetical protein
MYVCCPEHVDHGPPEGHLGPDRFTITSAADVYVNVWAILLQEQCRAMLCACMCVYAERLGSLLIRFVEQATNCVLECVLLCVCTRNQQTMRRVLRCIGC